MALSKILREKLTSDSVKMPLALEMGVAYSTLVRWMLDDQKRFETLDNIAAIEKITGLKQEEMFDNSENAATIQTI